MLIVFFRAVILYILIVISIRLMGKRQIGELQPSELVITLRFQTSPPCLSRI